MGLFIVTGLILQAVALVLLFRRLRGQWFVHAGAVFIVLATAYHGLNEILLWLFPNLNRYRFMVLPTFVSQFVLWISVAILLFTLAYLLAVRTPAVGTTDDAGIRRVFDWRLLLIAAVAVFVPTFAGGGYAAGAFPDALRLSTTQGLILQFLLLAVPLAGFAIVLRFGRRWFLPVLAIQSAALALVSQRLGILIAAAVVVYALVRAGVPIRRGQFVFAAVGFLAVAVLVTSARSEGRIPASASGGLRLDYLATGLANLGTPATLNGIAADLGYRLDGNSFGAMELAAFHDNRPTLGLQPLLNDLLLAIPSFLNPTKTYSRIEDRSDKEYATVYLGLPLPLIAAEAHEDILPTQLAGLMGFFGPWGLLIAASLLGVLFGVADRWLLRRLNPARLLLGVGLLSCVVAYERSWDTYPVVFRGILFLLPIVWLLAHRYSLDQHRSSLLLQHDKAS
jgi:hypothetical protein